MLAETQFLAAHKFERVAFILIPRFNMMTLTATIEAMRIANYLSPKKLFEWNFLSFENGPVSGDSGMAISCGAANETTNYDMVFIFGSWGCEQYVKPDIVNWVRRENRKGTLICAMELGAYVLARAGLLSDRIATAHWTCLPGFVEQFPKIDVREQLFAIDRNIITCAGGTASIDLMLHLISILHSKQLASEVADHILHHPARIAETNQRHSLSSHAEILHQDVAATIKTIENHISEPLSVPELAERVGLSQRQLERRFKRDMGCTIVQFSQLKRLQYARVLLMTTELSVREVSVASGFNSMSHFSHAFHKCFGKKPSESREAWPTTESAPSWLGTVYSLYKLPPGRLTSRPHNPFKSIRDGNHESLAGFGQKPDQIGDDRIGVNICNSNIDKAG